MWWRRKTISSFGKLFKKKFAVFLQRDFSINKKKKIKNFIYNEKRKKLRVNFLFSIKFKNFFSNHCSICVGGNWILSLGVINWFFSSSNSFFFSSTLWCFFSQIVSLTGNFDVSSIFCSNSIVAVFNFIFFFAQIKHTKKKKVKNSQSNLILSINK